MAVTVAELQVADAPGVWRLAGFTVDDDDVCRVGGVAIRLGQDGDGITGWSLAGLPTNADDVDVDGIATLRSHDGPVTPSSHRNGVVAIDHVVLLSPDLDRTVAALAAIGVDPRREREGELGGRPIRQIFFRFGEVIVEAVGAPGAASDGPSSLWGITYVVEDVEATAHFFGEHTAPLKDAVQPGRRITTLRHRELGMSVRTAMISARP